MTEPIRWGIAATGGIATKFAEDLELLGDAVIAAIASRAQERADDFGRRFDIPNRYVSHAAMAEDPDVDIIYIATPQSRHADDTIAFLEAGKPVLCEKPFALNERQATAMIDAARRAGVFLMEAIWSRFLPAYVELRRLISDGEIGQPQAVDADFGFVVPLDPSHRLFDNALGGGALLDLGIYPLQLASMVLGPAATVAAVGHIGVTNVDEHTAVTVRHEGGGISVSRAAIRVLFANRARIAATDGAIDVPAMMHDPDHLLVTAGGTTRRIDTPHDGIGLRFQAAEVHRCLRAGDLESQVMSLDETRQLAATMDAARAQIGLRYPPDA